MCTINHETREAKNVLVAAAIFIFSLCRELPRRRRCKGTTKVRGLVLSFHLLPPSFACLIHLRFLSSLSLPLFFVESRAVFRFLDVFSADLLDRRQDSRRKTGGDELDGGGNLYI